jgi:hypothetical protein
MQRLIVAATAMLAACGQPSATQTSAQGAEASAEAAEIKMSAGDHAALIAVTGYALAADGTVENACGERVHPQTLPADVGGSVGLAWLIVVGSGPNATGCYGDVPGGLYLVMRDADAYRLIFADSGYLAILPEMGIDGVHDVAIGGPGFSFPVYEWDGSSYVPADRMISDEELGRATMLP